MTLEQAKGWFDSIKDTPLKDRIFVLMLFVIFLLVGTNITVGIYLRNRENEANNLRIESERQLDILRNNNLKDSKSYIDAIAKERKDCNDYWESRFNTERDLNKKYLEDKADKLEQELNYLKTESRKIRNEAKSIKQKVNI